MSSTGNDGDDIHRPRLSLKESSAAAQRRSMNVRRHEISSQIRKAKRSHVVQLKRRLIAAQSSDMTTELDINDSTTEANDESMEISTPHTPLTTTAPGVPTENSMNSSISTAIQVKLYDVATAFLKAARSVSTAQQAHMTLSTFQRILAKAPSPTIVASLASFFMTNSTETYQLENRAFLLCQALANILDSTNIDINVRLEAAKVLTNLAAIDSLKDTSSYNGGGGEEEWDYYDGQRMMNRTSWCDVILESQAYSSVIQVLISFVSSASAPTDTRVILGTTQGTLDLCEQCSWALGNLAGDSQLARDTIKTRGGLSVILGTLRLAFQLAGFSSLRALALCRNSAWALSNMARGTLSSALPFLAAITSHPDITNQLDSKDWLLTQQDFFSYLLCPEQFSTQMFTQNLSLNEDINTTRPAADSLSWFDVCFEMCWVLAYLTAKEDGAVDFLCNHSHLESSIITAVAFRLSQVIHSIGNSSSVRISVPLIRVVGNIATASNGRFVTALLTTNTVLIPSSKVVVGFSPLSHSLATLIDLGCSNNTGFDAATIATEACWAAGALLCDTGQPLPHPSTAAASVLIPSLTQAFISGYSKLVLKREAISAIQNAISLPPSIESISENEADKIQIDDVRDGILANIASSRTFLRAIIDILKSSDTDAIFSSLQILTAFLQRLLNIHPIQSWLEEYHCREALESICDRASMSTACGQNYWSSDSGIRPDFEQCADIAADLIDDYFDISYSVIDDDDEEEIIRTGSLSFGTESIFPSRMGRGRGLGMVQPAWMNQTSMRD